MDMTYKQLQTDLKDLRDSGVDIGCKLSSSKEVLEDCYLDLIRIGLIKNLRNASLRNAVLRRADLSNACLSNADLRNAELCNANLSGADLSFANLSDANLTRADLSGANLSDSDLSFADLRNNDLSNVNLSGANLSFANLINANLSRADLSDTNLRYADLRRADLSDANLINADLSGTNGYKPVTQNSIDLILQVAEIVVKGEDKLEIKRIHSCDNVHCAVGWIYVLDPKAKELEKKFGWNVAACTVCPIPEFTSLFYSGNDKMLDFLTRTLADSGQSLREKYLVA